jgi:hypothetical protein
MEGPLAETPHNSGEPRKLTLDDVIDRAKSAADLAALATKYPKAREHLEVQARMEESLARLFTPPEIALPADGAAGRGRGWPRWLPFAAAAALLIAGVGVWWFALRLPVRDVLTPAYRETVAAGFVPTTVCTTDDDFARWCYQYVGRAIYPGHTEGVEYVGWNYAAVISQSSKVLLVKVGGEPVMVFMDNSSEVTVKPAPVSDPKLHVFTRRIGDVLMYEVSPKPAATVLPALSTTKG